MANDTTTGATAATLGGRRLVRDADFADVHRIYMDPAVVPFLGYDPMPKDEFRPVFDDLVCSGCFYAWEVDGAFAGFYRAYRLPGRQRHVAYLGTLAVDPAFHGCGVARAMFEDAITRLRGEGVIRIELLVEADNPRAIAFYRRYGFETEGVLRRAYRRAGEDFYVDEVQMALLVD